MSITASSQRRVMQNSHPEISKRHFLFFPLITTVIILLPFSLTLSWCPDVEGLRVGDISSTILQGKSLLSGSYPFWNHADGIGLPHPYGTNLIYHPIVMLFALLRFDVVILFLYLGHTLLGAYSMWYLCGYFQIEKPVKAVCVLTYLMSSPSLNYLIGKDFWPTCVVVWTGLPLLLLLLCKFIDTHERRILRIMVPAIAGLAGFMAVNSHLGALTYSMMGLGFFALANIQKIAHRWRYSLIILLMLALIFSEKFYMTYSEYSRFAFNDARTFQYLPPDMLTMFFWPLKTASLEKAYRAIHYRSFFMGFPFVFFALAGALWPSRLFRHQRAMALAAIICLILLFVHPKWMPGKVITTNYLWRDPLVLFFIILAGKTISLLFQENKRMQTAARIVLIVQVISLVIGLGPHWIDAFRKGLDHLGGSPTKVLRAYLEKGPAIEAIEKYGLEPGQRILLTHAVQSKLGYYSGFDYTLFRTHEMPLINGLFKGICYSDVSPSRRFMYGTVDPKPFLRDKDLLDTLSVAYLIAFADEIVYQSLDVLETIESAKGKVILYRNPDAMPMANVLNAATFGRHDYEKDQNKDLLHRDFSKIAANVRQGIVLKADRITNGFEVALAPQQDQCVLFINSYYLPSWTATGEIAGETIRLSVRSALGSLIAVELPAGTSEVRLEYRPWIRMILAGISWVTLICCFMVCVIWFLKMLFSRDFFCIDPQNLVKGH